MFSAEKLKLLELKLHASLQLNWIQCAIFNHTEKELYENDNGYDTVRCLYFLHILHLS